MRLTEDVIVTRSRCAKLHNIKELNLCGYNLTDVSVLNKLTNLEILALSVNNISSLAPLGKCEKLRELYLRRNSIQDVAELFHLQKLPTLTKLWLIENPFCLQLGLTYRETVLSILPNIKVLDNVAVTQEEIGRAKYVSVEYPEFATIPYNTQPHDFLLNAPVPNASKEQGSTNVLSAVCSLVKDLDLNALEAVHHQIGSRINELYSERH